jgi:hypothetical protein
VFIRSVIVVIADALPRRIAILRAKKELQKNVEY